MALNTVVREGLVTKVAVEQRLEGGERGSNGDTWGRVFHLEETTSTKVLSWNVRNMVMEGGPSGWSQVGKEGGGRPWRQRGNGADRVGPQEPQ